MNYHRPIPCAAIGCPWHAVSCESHYFRRGGVAFYYHCLQHSRPDVAPADTMTTERVEFRWLDVA